MSGWRNWTVPIFNGTFDTRSDSGKPYSTLPLVRVLGSPVAAKPKMEGPAFLPSTYAEHDARCHAVQRERGRYVALVADIDGGNHQPGRIAALVDHYAPRSVAVFYSTPHSRPGDMRWRVVLPLAKLLPFDIWQAAQIALFNTFRNAGVECDTAMARAAQPVFMPCVPEHHAKTGELLRDEAGRPLHFIRRVLRPDQSGLCLRQGVVASGMARISAERARAAREREAGQVITFRRPLSHDRSSLIDAFNAATDLPSLLRRYGYEQCPRNAADWRSPHQTSDTYATRIMAQGKWVSLSGSDASAGLGVDKEGARWGDAFDLFCAFEHGGNRKVALRHLAAEQREAAR